MESFVIPPELFTAMQYIHNNFSDISFSIKTKLNYLSMYLLRNYGTEEDRKNHSHLILQTEKEMNNEEEKIEFSQIRNLPPEIATKIYVDTVCTLFPSSQLMLTSLTKKATLCVRSQMLKIWGERGIELNFGKKIFIIQKSSPKKPDKVLDLLTYELKWLGEIKSRYCFGLDSKTPKNHYKSFCIGSEKMEVAKDWYESIRLTIVGCYISTFIEQRNKREKSLKKPRTQDDINLSQRKLENNNSFAGHSIMAMKTVKTFKQIKDEFEKKKTGEPNAPTSKLKKNNSQSFNENILKSFDAEDFLGEKKKNFGKINLDRIEEKPHENLPTPEIKALNLETQNLFFLHENEIEKKGEGDNSPNFKFLESGNHKEIEEDFGFYKKEEMEENFELLKNSEVEKENQTKREFLLKPKKQNIIKKIENKRKIFGKKITKIKTPNFFLDHIIQKTKNKRNVVSYLNESPNIDLEENELIYRSQSIVPKNDLESFHVKNQAKINFSKISCHINYKTIYSERSLLFLKNKKEKNRYKMFLCFPYNYRLLIHYFLETQHFKEYNQFVSEINYVNLSQNNKNCFLLFLKLKLNNSKFLDLTIKRTLFENDEYFLINDESISFPTQGKKENTKLSFIYLILIRKKDQKDNSVIIDIAFKNDYSSNKNEIFDVFFGYLKSFSGMRFCFGEKICHFMENYKSQKRLIIEKIIEKKEVKCFFEERFLISNPKTINNLSLFSPSLKKQKNILKKRSKSSESSNNLFRNKRKKIADFKSSINEFGSLKKKLLTYPFENHENLFMKSPKFKNMKNWKEKLSKNNFLINQRNFIHTLKFHHYENLIDGLNIFDIQSSYHCSKNNTCLENIAKAFAIAPLFLNPLTSSNPMDRMKAVAAFLMGLLNVLISPKIPFKNENGETLNLVIDKENFLYFEVFNEKILVLMHGKSFKIHGYVQPNFKIYLNEIILGYEFNLIVDFKDQKMKILDIPTLKSFDDNYGKRIFIYEGILVIYDELNEILCEINFGSRMLERNMFSFCGKNIINYNEYRGWMQTVKKNEFSEFFNKRFYNIDQKRKKIIKKTCKIEGDILSQIFIDKEVYWDFNNKIDILIGYAAILPSDCIFNKRKFSKKKK